MIRSFLSQAPKKLLWIWAAGFALRLVATFFAGTAPDYVGYRLPIAECLTSGQWLYCDCNYNHTPFYPYLSALMNLMSGGIPWLQTVLITLPLAIGDALVALVFYVLLVRIKKEDIAFKASAFYALNPMAIIEVGIAHWDGFTTFFFLLSMLYLHDKKIFGSGVAAGFGVLLKQFPLAIVLIGFSRDKNFKRAFLLGTTTVFVVLLGFLPFLLKCPETFFQNLAGHPLWKGAASSEVGIGTLKDVSERLSVPHAKLIWVGLFVALIGIPFFKTNERNYFYYAGLVLVTLAYFTFVTHRQLLIWAMPFLIVLTLEKKTYVPFALVFVGYAIRIIKPDWYFGLLHLGVGVWYYIAFFKTLTDRQHAG
ncbi:MAG: glycosyltransferase 87 family protein [Bacteroidota bacterium]